MNMILPRTRALTICIPTYNRGKRVHALVLFLKRNLLPLTDDVEIVVVNNCSNDGTRELIEPLVGGAITLVNRTEFLDTAESNMFHSLALCGGEFVWYHGDDDIPAIDTILSLITMIRQDVADLYVFNSPVIDDDGIVISRRMANMRTSHLDVSGDSLVETAGFVFMLAGITNVIFRREKADIEVAWEANAIQPLYGHVCWLLACFGQLRTRIVNRPLVYYRNSDPAKQVAHFKKVAKHKNVGDSYFWGIGVALQFKWLVERGIISASALPRVFEGRRDDSRYKLLNEIIRRIYVQVLESIGHSDERFLVDQKTFTEVRDFLVSCDLFVYDLFEPIERLNEIATGQRSLEELEGLQKTFEHLHRLHDEDIYRNNWQGERSGYQIYRMACHWVAVRPEVEGGILNALSVIDLEERAPLLLIDADFETLVSRADAHAREYVAPVPAPATIPTVECVAPVPTPTIIQTGQSLAELERLGRQHIDLMHRVVHEYTHSVQIYRQATLLGRKLSRVIIFPFEQFVRLGKRLLAS
ncbi:glycosyltransferase family 2 protein [Pseudomonas mosselii]|uniref:Glycosyltransferase n=1 Tax=Pseudomonas mosselii TaxID=78327 RepID=A0AA42ULK2_9PSED|nr:glycosyltransferase [Pseudomonas mosselii]MDH1630672.1 glycosyltransferase [Pseudomonas mosselii]